LDPNHPRTKKFDDLVDEEIEAKKQGKLKYDALFEKYRLQIQKER
jgi:hypothetical protein